MRVKPYRTAAPLLCALLSLALCPDAFGQVRPERTGPVIPGQDSGQRHPRTQRGKPPPRSPDTRFPPGVPGLGNGRRSPFGTRAEFLSSELRIGDRLVKGAPFSARFVAERTLTHGATRRSAGAIYRSAEGRTRREIMLDPDAAVASDGDPPRPRHVLIDDLAAGVQYSLDESARAALKSPLSSAPPASQPDPAPAQGTVRTVPLGRRTIEGVEAEGTRTFTTIPAGTYGKDRRTQLVSERWFSHDLQVVVLSRRSVPFVGEVVYRLTNITRGEPAPALFEVPADYNVVEEKGPRNPPSPPQK